MPHLRNPGITGMLCRNGIAKRFVAAYKNRLSADRPNRELLTPLF